MKTTSQASNAPQSGSHAHNVTQPGDHSHTAWTDVQGAHTHSIDGAGSHSHGITDPGHAHPLPVDRAAATQAEPPKDPNTHTLDTPITRGGQMIDKITLRKPSSGELRGVSLADLVNLDVGALSKVLPRITTPTLTEFDVAQLDPADLVQLGGMFAGFLMPRAAKARMESLNA